MAHPCAIGGRLGDVMEGLHEELLGYRSSKRLFSLGTGSIYHQKIV